MTPVNLGVVFGRESSRPLPCSVTDGVRYVSHAVEVDQPRARIQ
jgi:hypothetical protein